MESMSRPIVSSGIRSDIYCIDFKAYYRAIFVLAVVSLCACVPKNNHQAKGAAGRYIGREVQFSNLIPMNVPEGMDIDSLLSASRYSVVVYVDSSSCEDCRIYNALTIRGYELDLKRKQKEIPFIYIFNTPDIFLLRENLGKYGFHHYCFIDLEHTFLSDNGLPADKKYHTFLLEDNKIKVIGNPSGSKQVRARYNEALF